MIPDLLAERVPSSYVGKVISVATGAVLALRVWPADPGNDRRAKAWADMEATKRTIDTGRKFRSEVEIEWRRRQR